jgi:hypothetical protein
MLQLCGSQAERTEWRRSVSTETDQDCMVMNTMSFFAVEGRPTHPESLEARVLADFVTEFCIENFTIHPLVFHPLHSIALIKRFVAGLISES